MDGTFFCPKLVWYLLITLAPSGARGCYAGVSKEHCRLEECLLSMACKFLSVLMAKDYRAAGQAASALHAMALLQVYQAKAHKELRKG